MKSLKTLSLVFAAALITLGASAQTQTTPASSSTPNNATHVTKDKTKTTEKPNGTTKTTTKSKPTKKVDNTTSTPASK